MEIRPYDPAYRQAFIKFNTAWIVSYFGRLEPEDLETFETIDQALTAGAMIYFALEGDTPLSCCMARPARGTTWEICKMGSNPDLPHRGVGGPVLEACMDWALGHGARKLTIVSNRVLGAALHIYAAHGFREVPLDRCAYDRGDIALEYVPQTQGSSGP